MLFAANEYAIGTSGYHHILQSIDKDRVLKFIDDVGVLAMSTHYGITDDVLLELVSKGVPSAKVFPFARERYDCY